MADIKWISFKAVWLHSWKAVCDTYCDGMINTHLMKSSYIINVNTVKACV